MSDTGGGGEPDASGREGMRQRAGRAIMAAGARLGNVAAQANEFKDLKKAIDGVTASLETLSQKSGRYADTIARNLNKVSTAMTGSSAGMANASGTTAGSAAAAAQRATIPVPAPPSTGDPQGTRASGAMTAASWLGSAVSNDTVANMMMTPLRFTRDRIQTNRNVVLTASNMLNMTGLRGGGASGYGGVGQEEMLEHLGSNIGRVKGTPGELISLLASAGPLGASYGFGNEGAQGVRGSGFFAGIRQMQALNPGASVQSMVGALGGQAANTGAQQQSMMMTGGAYSMIGRGGRQKSLTEWADSIMKWLVDLRPGPLRGKAFSYGELMSQYYPGSNVDAWFDANQVSQEMREYWWTYALGKVSGSVASDANGDIFQTSGQAGPGGKATDQKNNLSALRLASTNVMTQGEFALGGKMSGAYGNREQSNRAFNEMIQSFLAQALPAALMSGPLASIMNMPDIIEDLLFGMLERSPSGLKSVVGAGALGSMFLGDVGDIGDMPGSYGDHGGTTTSGMHPDMKRKVGAMQQANPRIRVTSGLRDTGLQQRLKKKGYANVSGGPSAHTRGMAADLGPSSEYGWISKNASKFGLKSGRNQGEPWHVGMGDASDDLFGTLKGLWSGESSGASGMFDMMEKVLGMLTSGIMAGSDGSTGPMFDAGLYDKLSQSVRAGVNLQRVRVPGASGNFGVPSTVGGLGGGPVVVGGSGASPGSPEAGRNAAIALFNAGFKKREDLEKILAIAGRESHWNPTARNPNGEDIGLMQINKNAHADKLAARGYGVADLIDIQKNANIAHDIFMKSPDFMAWNYSNTSAYWGAPLRKGWANANNTTKSGQNIGGGYASPFVETNLEAAKGVVAAAAIPGLGDMAEYQTPMMTGGGAGRPVVFVNTFNLQGGNAAGPSSGGIDVRRTVTMMADHLENEMKMRLARSN